MEKRALCFCLQPLLKPFPQNYVLTQIPLRFSAKHHSFINYRWKEKKKKRYLIFLPTYSPIYFGFFFLFSSHQYIHLSTCNTYRLKKGAHKLIIQTCMLASTNNLHFYVSIHNNLLLNIFSGHIKQRYLVSLVSSMQHLLKIHDFAMSP